MEIPLLYGHLLVPATCHLLLSGSPSAEVGLGVCCYRPTMGQQASSTQPYPWGPVAFGCEWGDTCGRVCTSGGSGWHTYFVIRLKSGVTFPSLERGEGRRRAVVLTGWNRHRLALFAGLHFNQPPLRFGKRVEGLLPTRWVLAQKEHEVGVGGGRESATGFFTVWNPMRLFLTGAQ